MVSGVDAKMAGIVSCSAPRVVWCARSHCTHSCCEPEEVRVGVELARITVGAVSWGSCEACGKSTGERIGGAGAGAWDACGFGAFFSGTSEKFVTKSLAFVNGNSFRHVGHFSVPPSESIPQQFSQRVCPHQRIFGRCSSELSVHDSMQTGHSAMVLGRVSGWGSVS